MRRAITIFVWHCKNKTGNVFQSSSHFLLMDPAFQQVLKDALTSPFFSTSLRLILYLQLCSLSSVSFLLYFHFQHYSRLIAGQEYSGSVFQRCRSVWLEFSFVVSDVWLSFILQLFKRRSAPWEQAEWHSASLAFLSCNGGWPPNIILSLLVRRPAN